MVDSTRGGNEEDFPFSVDKRSPPLEVQEESGVGFLAGYFSTNSVFNIFYNS